MVRGIVASLELLFDSSDVRLVNFAQKTTVELVLRVALLVLIPVRSKLFALLSLFLLVVQ